MGESIVLPYLRTIGAKKIDKLVVSHGDNDHIGGAFSLLKSLQVKVISTSVPEKIPTKLTEYCVAGQSWQWDNIHFSFLYPTLENMKLGNDSSCVLRIDNGVHRVLLTGDIEKFAEKFLVNNAAKELSADVLIAPHHGSKTSGVKEFVAAVHPDFVLYATGYRNRYHFPHQTIVETYTQMNSIQLNSVDAGAIIFHFTQSKNLFLPIQYRQAQHHYWFQ